MPTRQRYRYFTLYTLTRMEPQLAVCDSQKRQLKSLALDYGRKLVAQLDVCNEAEFRLKNCNGGMAERLLSTEFREAKLELYRLEGEYRRAIAEQLSAEQRHSLSRFLVA